jgi:hypothetical protein
MRCPLNFILPFFMDQGLYGCQNRESFLYMQKLCDYHPVLDTDKRPW